MLKSVRIVLFLVLIMLTPGLDAQDSAAYVSRLTAQPGLRSVVLTWTDAEGYPGAQYEIWRSQEEIVKDSLSKAKLLATVDAGVEAYEDTTITEPSYYLVLLKEASGNRRAYYIPFRNKTAEAVQPEGTAATLSTARIRIGAVTYANPQVLIPFQALPTDRKLVVFRRAGPITSLADLKDATLLGTTSATEAPYRDTPAPGLEFYYAILDAQAFADGRPDAFQAENATDRPVGFPLVATTPTQTQPAASIAGAPVEPSSRALPLPRLQFGTELDSGAPLAPSAYEPVQPQPLSAETETALKRWAKATLPTGSGLPALTILPEERTAVQDGAARYLVQIQKAYLEPQDWKGAIGSLENLLKLTLDRRTEARARFYLGQALAKTKDYRRAFLEFLGARDSYPNEVAPFLEALLTLLESESN